MTKNFNTYIEHIDVDAWREICVNKGTLRQPQQRYDELVNRYPDLFDLFSLKDIASFLKITPTHLSRLRKNNGNQR